MAEQSYSRWGAFGGGPNDQPTKKAVPDQGSVGFGSSMSGPNKGTPLEQPQQMQDMKYRVPEPELRSGGRERDYSQPRRQQPNFWDQAEGASQVQPNQGAPNEISQAPQEMGIAQSPQQSFGRSQQPDRETWMNRGGGGPQEFAPPQVESEGSPRGGYQNMREQVFPSRPSQQSQGFNQPQSRRRPPGIRYNRGSQNSGGRW